MAIYRGAGGAGDATGDSASEALLVLQLANEAALDAAAAEAAKIAAQAAQAAAQTAETNAETAETNAETAETNAETAQAAAASSASNAASSASSASTSATNAASSASAASGSASAASTSATNAANSASSASSSASTATTQATNASNSATAAATSATNASNSASAASTSATNAANSATAAQTAENNAETAETNAETAQTAAELAETNAETAATNAASSASAASTSASNAASSASAASTSATNASNSASAASTSATNASNSATAAASSASSASSSASTATTQASNASTSATNAASSASSASSSATTATTQAGIATTQATNAASSASAASTSASNASTSATNASNSASAAATSASNASTSATSAANAQSAAETARDQTLAAFDSFDDRYLGQKSTAPTVDNDGNALVAGALYFNTTTNEMKVYDGSTWLNAYASLSGALLATNNLSDLNNVSTARTNLGLGTAATTNSTAYATAAQGAKADTALQPATIGVSVQGYDADTAKLDVSQSWSAAQAFNAGVTLGDASGDALTINSSAVSIPNGLNFDSNTLVIDATNNRVGVGTASPNYNITVNGGASASVIQLVNTASGTTSGDGLLIYQDGVDARVQNTESGSLTLFTGNTERMRIDSGGNLLVGSSSSLDSSFRLQVTGAGGTISTSTGANANSLRFDNTNTTSEWSFGTNSPGVGSAGDYFAWSRLPSGGSWSEFMRINNSGNVGIGTSSPNQIFHVRATTPYIQIERAGNASALVGSDSTGMYIGSLSAIPIYFNTNGSERMRLDSSGNLGLGVTPSAWTSGVKAVQIGLGASVFGSTASYNNTNITANMFYNSGGTAIYQGSDFASFYQQVSGSHRWFNAPSGTAGNAITFTQAMTLDASGNLGIGSTSPSTPLGSAKGLVIQSSGDNAQIRLLNSTSGSTGADGVLLSIDGSLNGYLWNYENSNFLFGTNNTERMRITSSGNVQVGMTTGARKLNVQGYIGAFHTSGTNDSHIAIYNDGTTSNIASTYTSTGSYLPMAFQAGGAERARISTAGGFSVGTTADPGAGAIYATGAITAYYSDDRLKTKLGYIENALDKVKALSGFYYEANQTAQDLGYQAVREVGVSAQQVQAVMPEVVKPAPIDQKYLTVDYERLVPLLIEAIKELEAQVAELKAK